MGQVYDLSDPSEPLFIRDFGLPGQQPGATGTVPADMHGVMSTGPKGNRVYAGYGTTKRRRDRNSRPRQTDPRAQGSHRGEPRISRSSPGSTCRRTSARTRRIPCSAWTCPNSRKNAQAKPARFPVVVPGETTDNECHDAKTDAAHLRHHHRIENPGRFHMDRAGSQRQFLQPRRPLRHALDE